MAFLFKNNYLYLSYTNKMRFRSYIADIFQVLELLFSPIIDMYYYYLDIINFTHSK